MRLIPKTNQGKINFCRTHLPKWEENAAELGFDPEAIARLTAETEAARLAFDEQRAALQAAKTATQKLDIAIKKMQGTASVMISYLRGHSKVTQNKSIYTLAEIPAPSKRSKMAPPGKPYQFTMKMDQIGLVTIMWKCKNPYGAVGTMYEITRFVDGVRTEPVKVGKKKFVDTNVRSGTRQVLYEIRGVRGNTHGEVATYVVMVGNNYEVPNAELLNYPHGSVAA